jgi:ligand-binding sensor domain-containing protein/signal transduction histidine kinase
MIGKGVILVVILTACAAQGTGPGAVPFPNTGVPLETAASEGDPSLHPEAATVLRFTHLGLADGLSQSAVSSILQDRQGFLWIGTHDGLNRYDGYAFKVFRPDPKDPRSISDGWINALHQDRQGRIWIATRQGGVNVYDPVTGEITRFVHDPSAPNSLVSNRVQALLQDSLGSIWIGTAQGLDRYSPARNGFEHYSLSTPSLPDPIGDNITAILEDSRGILWIGTSVGLSRYDRRADAFVAYTGDFGEGADLIRGAVHGLAEDASKRLWIGTGEGLYLLDPANGQRAHYRHAPQDPGSLSSNAVQAIYLDRSHTLWIGTSDGLDRFDEASGEFVHARHEPGLDFSLANSTVTAIHESADGVLWIGTQGGLDMSYRGQHRFGYLFRQPDLPTGLSGNLVRKVFIDSSGLVWISMLDAGLNALDPGTGLLTRYQHDSSDPGSLMSNEVRAAIRDRYGTLWVGSSLGVDRLDPGAAAFVHVRPQLQTVSQLAAAPVNDFAETRDGRIWIATESGLFRYDLEAEEFRHYRPHAGDAASLSGYEVVELYQDRAGVLWIGTFNDGLNRYHPETDDFTRFQHQFDDPSSLSNDSVLAIHQDARGVMWVGTAGGGLNRFDAEAGGFRHYLEADGLANNVVYCILEDDSGHIWLSTNKGISRFDPVQEQFSNYSASDGLQADEFSPNACAKDATGNLYFGGVNGLTVFDPDEIVASSYLPPIVLLSLTPEGQPASAGAASGMIQEVTLRWPSNSFEFAFAALSYAQPEENQYAYILEGFEADWHFIGTERRGQYTNIPGGTYTLRLTGSNQDGLWNESGLEVRVIIIPPVWQTWWFRSMLALGAVALLLTVYRVRVKSVEASNLQLEKQVRDRTAEIERLFEKAKELAVIEERSRLARELHDSAKQKAFAALAQLGTANGVLAKDPTSARGHLVEAENLVYEVIEGLTFFIQEMYPLGLKEKGLATSLREYVFEWENRTDIQATVSITSETRLALEIEQAVYRVVQEALSNVARHSHATRVELSLSYGTDAVEIAVIDNGSGFDPEAKPAGIGLRSIRERVESLHGSVELESSRGRGTLLRARLPLKP